MCEEGRHPDSDSDPEQSSGMAIGVMEKKEIRRLVAERKKGYSDAWLTQWSKQITERLPELPCWQETETVFAYMDMPGEVKMRDFIRRCWEAGKTVAVPKIIRPETAGGASTALKEMRFFRIDSFEVLSEGTMHIMEPDPERCECLDCEKNALIIMPGVAFDTDRHRIGYGGGFYDRYLADHPEHPTVAVAFGFQVFDRIPSDEQDIRPQILVTEDVIMQ